MFKKLLLFASLGFLIACATPEKNNFCSFPEFPAEAVEDLDKNMPAESSIWPWLDSVQDWKEIYQKDCN